MTSPQQTSADSPDPFRSPGNSKWMSGSKLMLVGVGPRVAVELTELYRLGRRSLPSIQVFATATGALEQLAEESFDCVLVVHSALRVPSGIDAQNVCTAIRAAGSTDAILVLTALASDPLFQAVCETAAEIYVGTTPWQSPALLQMIDRAIRQRELTRDSQRRTWADSQRVDRERAACEEILRHQRQLLVQTASRQFGSVDAILPPQLPQIYREILRTYVMTGTVSLTVEIKKLAQTFALARLTPRQVWQLHVEQVELLVKGIGQRSARHILDRANVLCLELMVLLCEFFESENARTWWAWRRQPVADTGISLERRAA